MHPKPALCPAPRSGAGGQWRHVVADQPATNPAGCLPSADFVFAAGAVGAAAETLITPGAGSAGAPAGAGRGKLVRHSHVASL